MRPTVSRSPAASATIVPLPTVAALPSYGVQTASIGAPSWVVQIDMRSLFMMRVAPNSASSAS